MKKKGGFRNIFLLGTSSLLNDIGSEAINPLVPFYLTALGGTGVAVGLMGGLREGLASLFKLLGGWLSDRVGKRKPFVFIGYLISTLFRFLVSIANSWPAVVSFLAVERFGKSRDAPRDVIITQSTNHHGHGFGFHEAMDRTGAILGTLLAIFLFWKFNFEIKNIILIAAGISLLSVIPIFFVKEKKTKPLRKNIFKGIKDLNAKLKYFIFVTFIFALGNFGLYLFLLLRVKEISGNIIIPLVIYAIFNLFYAVFSVPFGNLSDKIGRKKVLFIGYILFFFLSLSFIFVNSILPLGILFIVYGLVYAITQSNQKAFVSDLSGKMKGTAIGFYYSVTGIAAIVGGLIAGILWDVNHLFLFGYTSVIALVSVLLLIFVKSKKI